MSVKHCDSCQHFVANREGECSPICSKGHSPTFKMPRSPVDLDYGYRRNCKDFEQRRNERAEERMQKLADDLLNADMDTSKSERTDLETLIEKLIDSLGEPV